jgi:hypothetical protein
VHVEILDPQMKDAFVDYLVKQKQELLEQKAVIGKLVTYFDDKIAAIDVILKNVKNDKTLSWTEQKVLTRFCNELKHDIRKQLSELKLGESIDDSYYEIHKLIEAKMDTMIQSSARISIRSGFRGVLNDVCEACGLGRPFAISHGEVQVAVRLMKSTVQDLRVNELEKLKEKEPAQGVTQGAENNVRLR